MARGKNPTGPNGTPLYEQGRLMGSLHGSKKCEEKPPVVVTPTVSTTEVKGEATPEVLPSTGAETVLGGAIATGSLAASLQYYRQSRIRR